MMQFAHKHLALVRGMSFYKLMGSGKGMGFNPFPDWGTYALLQTWNSEEDALEFMHSSELMRKYKNHCLENWTVFMRNISAHGTWDGGNPFLQGYTDEDIPYIAVITRATIRTRSLIRFWKYVPTSQIPLIGNTGLVYTKGIGEVPIVNMATFSLWEDKDSLQKFAYQSKEHHKAIEMTRELNWYKEELFSRFQPYMTLGSWGNVKLGLKNLS